MSDIEQRNTAFNAACSEYALSGKPEQFKIGFDRGFKSGWQAAKQDVGECTWSESEDGQYDTSCGGIFELTVDTPEENEFKFCCYCGGVLKQKLFEQLREQ